MASRNNRQSSILKAHGRGGSRSWPPVAYISEIDLERVSGPLRIAHLPGGVQPVYFSLHGAVASHYGLPPDQLKESHATTLDYVAAAAG